MALDSRYKAVAFDMDGTLMDSEVDYAGLANLVFDEMIEMGVPVEAIDRSEGSKFNLDSGLEWLRLNGRGKEIFDIQERISKRARDIEMENADEARPYPGAEELLVILKDGGYRTGVVTRGCREYCLYILGKCGMLPNIDAVVARDDYPEEQGKPSPMALKNLASKLGVSADEILFLGDHKFDYFTARDSGAGFIGVLSGTFGTEDWRALGVDDLIGTVSELLGRL